MYNHIITICSYIIMMHNQANVIEIMLERSSEYLGRRNDLIS